MSAISNGARVLLLNRRLPSHPRSGVDLRIAEQLHALVTRGPTGIFALAGGGPPLDPALEAWRASTDPTSSRPIIGPDVAKFMREGTSPIDARYSDATASELVEAIREFRPDVVVVGPLELSPYVEVIRDTSDARVALDLHENLAPLVPQIAKTDEHRGRALLSRILSEQLRSAERTAVSDVDQVWMASEPELATLLSEYPDAAPGVLVPNTVDVTSYPQAAREDPLALVYPAGFFYPPNQDAARTLVRDILPKLPDARLALVGVEAPSWMLELDDPRVTVTGEVPDVRPYLAAAGAMPVPLVAGGGTRLKVLEAFSAGLPVVSTAKGVEGLDLVDGRQYLRAEDPTEFVAALERLRADPALADALVEGGHAIAIERYSRDALRTAISAALETLLDAPSRSCES